MTPNAGTDGRGSRNTVPPEPTGQTGAPIPEPASGAGHPGVGVGSPLSAEHVAQLAVAHKRAKKVRRAVAVARFNGWTLGACAAISLLLGMFEASGWVLGLVLGAVAGVELWGSGRLRRLEPTAARWLGFNQLGLGALLIGYALWQMIAAVQGPSPYAQYLNDPDLANLLGNYEDATRKLTVAVYACLIAFAVIIQGGTALYYFTRAKHIRCYVADTPAWIVQLQRSGVQLT
jgi:hypothetical protein